MSGESLRKGIGRVVGGNIVRPESVTEKTLMESVAGFINEVGLVTQPYASGEEKENHIVWTKFEEHHQHANNKWIDLMVRNNDPPHPPLLLTLGYHSGVQMWAIPSNGEAQEVLSWKRPAVRLFKLLPPPFTSSLEMDIYQSARPVVAIVEGSSGPTSPNHLSFVSLRSGENLKSIKYIHPVCDLKANLNAVVVSFLDKIQILDPIKYDVRTTITSSAITIPSTNPIALGTSWLAYTERKVYSMFQSSGGVANSGPPSYTATVLYAAKSLSKGLKGLGESVANSLTGGHRIPHHHQHQQHNSLPNQYSHNDNLSNSNSSSEPGIINIINLNHLKFYSEFSLNDLALMSSSSSPQGPQGPSSVVLIAHFIAHLHQPVQSMSFDQSGLVLVTADRDGHDFHVFRIQAHPLCSSMSSAHHLYVLHRGDTGAKVQDISFSPDTRWVTVSTRRGTTHLFPITPYGGGITVRTHTSNKVVNRLSRFHRTAGLDDGGITSGRNSPIIGPGLLIPTSAGGSSGIGGGGSNSGKYLDMYHMGSPYPNPRIPPFPSPITLHPLAQLRQSFINVSPKSSPPTGKSAKGILSDDRMQVVSAFEAPRGWLIGSPPLLPCDTKRKNNPVDALFVMTCHGNLIEYSLVPTPIIGNKKEKVSDDSSIELSVHAKAQWNLKRPTFTKDLQPPLHPSNIILLAGFGQKRNYIDFPPHPSSPANINEKIGEEENDILMDERWLSQVEITTHTGPHRRLWMGPQFRFFHYLSQSGCPSNVETVEVNVTNRPAKSNPVNMPASSSFLPAVVIESSSGSSLEQSPRLVEPYYSGSSNITDFDGNDSQIKENLADAMLENSSCAVNRGGCQSLGSCDDLSSSSYDSTNGTSLEPPFTPSFSIDASLPFPD